MANYKTIGRDEVLQDFYSIDIEEEDDSYVVYFNSRIHVTKRKKLNPSFSKSFTHEQILRDHNIVSNIYQAYGRVTVCHCH